MAQRVKGSVSVLLGAVVICMIEDANRSHGRRVNVPVPPPVIRTVVETIQAVFEERPQNMTDVIKMSLAADYLGKILPSWIDNIPDFDHLMRLLLDLTHSQWDMLKDAATRTLMQAGKSHPLRIVKLMGDVSLNDHVTVRRNSALFTLISMAKKHPAHLLKHLPLTVETVIKCLDPSRPKRRQTLIKASTATLHCLVQKYPSVGFHQDSQHFAIGTGRKRDCAIIIYDLRTATKWRVLRGHKGRITALDFNKKGDQLVSYAGYENPPTLRVWSLGSDGIIGTLLGNTARCIKVVELKPPRHDFSPLEHITTTSIHWSTGIKVADKAGVQLRREDGSTNMY